MAITVIACWARFLEGVAEDGSPIEIVDDRIPDLRARAARHDDNILAVVGGNPLFHGLEGRSEFERPYAHMLSRIRTLGVDAALAATLSPARAPLPRMTEPPHSRRDRSSRPATKTSSSWPEPPAPEPQRRPTHLGWSPAGPRPTRSTWPSSRLGPAAQWP